MLFVELGLLSACIIFLSRVSAWIANRDKNESVGSHKTHHEPYRHGKQSQSRVIAGRLHAIAGHLEAKEEQDSRQDNERAFREKITIAALVFAGLAAFASDVLLKIQLSDARDAAGIQHTDAVAQHADTIQALEAAKQANIAQQNAAAAQLAVLQSQAATARDQALAAKVAADAAKTSADANTGQLEEMRVSSRAWVGPTDSGLTDPPKVNSDNKAQVGFVNSGREPATELQIGLYQPFPTNNVNDTLVIQAINENKDKCFASTTEGGSVVYPNVVVGFGGTTNNQAYTVPISGAWITENVLARRTALVFTGCAVYKTAGAVHHSSWCYYWSGDATAYQHLNICIGAGNDAD